MRLRLWDEKPECVELKPSVPRTQRTPLFTQKYTLTNRAPTSADAIPVLRTSPHEPLATVRTFEGNFKIRKAGMSVVLSISAPFSVAPEKCREGSNRWGPRVGGSLESEILSSREHDPAWLPLDPARTRPWLGFLDPFQGVPQSFAPKVIFYMPGTRLPSSPVRLRKPVVPENPQRKAPPAWIGGLSM